MSNLHEKVYDISCTCGEQFLIRRTEPKDAESISGQTVELQVYCPFCMEMQVVLVPQYPVPDEAT